MKISYFSKIVGVFMLMAVAVSPAWANAPAGNSSEPNAARATELQHRLEEIKALDKKELSRSEKKVLRNEVREIKKEMAAISGGVYLSVGAIILIALLLILLL